ncbi:hypothetical protein IAD21_00632 [Abditibacteriota bacterium]|nr:hypothetical protein IAD21_00632 [Abditibacteriota bacterium]
MNTPRRPFDKRLSIFLIPLTAIAALMFWFYPRDLNLSQVRSSSIKNDKGQPAQLLWWTPAKGVDVMQAPRKEDGPDVDGRIMPSDWWMDGRCFKVAEIGNAPTGMVKVYLYPEDVVASDVDRLYLAQRKDLRPTISVGRLQQEWSDSNFSTW